MHATDHIREPIFYIDNDDFNLVRLQTCKTVTSRGISRCKFRSGIDSLDKIVGCTTVLVMFGYRVRLKLTI